MTGFEVAAGAYDRFVGRYGAELAERFCETAGIRSPMRALDVGCGPGALTTELALRLGADALAAVDPSEPFVAACRERVSGADVRLAGAEDLPFGDGEFDAVLAQLVINFVPDPQRAVTEMRRVARPGAVVGAVVWDYAGGMTMLRAFWDAARDVCGEAAIARDEGRVMRFCTAEALGGLFGKAGCADVAVVPLEVVGAYSGFDDLWWPFEQGVGPAGAFTAAQPQDQRSRISEALRQRLGHPEGPFVLSARAWCAVATN